jgi:hypothetical protein
MFKDDAVFKALTIQMSENDASQVAFCQAQVVQKIQKEYFLGQMPRYFCQFITGINGGLFLFLSII